MHAFFYALLWSFLISLVESKVTFFWIWCLSLGWFVGQNGFCCATVGLLFNVLSSRRPSLGRFEWLILEVDSEYWLETSYKNIKEHSGLSGVFFSPLLLIVGEMKPLRLPQASGASLWVSWTMMIREFQKSKIFVVISFAAFIRGRNLPCCIPS